MHQYFKNCIIVIYKILGSKITSNAFAGERSAEQEVTKHCIVNMFQERCLALQTVCIKVSVRQGSGDSQRGRGRGWVEVGESGENGDRKRLFLERWVHNAMCTWCVVELYT